ncbi:MarR family winged helix-turn-helix transcriptional regulator [Streptacidiphilus jiangxiensis]|uniref:DNA-binding transcriptional regulator, MarR family n=1 Tax=Streptacidiphilus jiangxiensis TaxID=235985 RepID=A0A1H7MX33_STRJI|nr:MarR family transcriptional regulator [Streptacidiphilus jiangxiensis]SEL15177.1 DNA-binding transcriptional regulator, MarR family [Streptacidiphilus jiangxiensis]
MTQQPSDADAVDRIVAQWRRERPDLDSTPVHVIGRISRLHWALDERLAQVFDRYDLGRGEFDILASLRRAGAPFELTAGELRGSTMVTSGAVTKRVDRLERAGLVSRRTAHEDARGRIIGLTERGRALVDEAVAAHLHNEATLLAGLTTDERATLADLLRKLGRSLPGA